jgi:hypothetical protein
MAMEARIPMMAMTISNSMSVKPEPLILFDIRNPMPRPSSRFPNSANPVPKNRPESRLMKYVNSQQSTAKVYIIYCAIFGPACVANSWEIDY